MDDTRNLLTAVLGAAALAGLFSLPARSEPYFTAPASIAELKRVQVQAGLALDPLGKHGKEGLAEVLPVYHAPASPTWTDPVWGLALGFSGSTWKDLHLAAGPAANLLPQVQAALYAGLDAAFPNSFDNLKDSLTPADPSKLDSGLTLSAQLLAAPANGWYSRGVVSTSAWFKFWGPVGK